MWKSLGLPARALIGVVHLGALPGAPRYEGSLEEVLGRARYDADRLRAGGCDALIVENFGDAPFHGQHVPPETVAAMTLGTRAVQEVAGDLPVGVNVLRNDARAALGICAATGARFLRVNVHTGAAVTDQGVLTGRAAETLRERARLAPDTLILADVHVKHASPLGASSLEEEAADALHRGLADALIFTGRATGRAPAPPDWAGLRAVLGEDAPLLLGSGVTPENVAGLLGSAQGAIVGTALKAGGRVTASVEVERVRAMRAALDALNYTR